MDFLESKTIINLARTFAGECQDGAKYQFLAKKAEEEAAAAAEEAPKKRTRKRAAKAEAEAPAENN